MTQIYLLEINQLAPEFFLPFLNQDELTHTHKLSPLTKKEFIICRATTKILLAKKLKTSPQTLTIKKTKLGKPYIDSLNISFNISHSYPFGAITISPAKSIGIDIQVTQKPFPTKILSRILHPNETHTESSIENYIIWSKKEAYLKAKGDSIFNATQVNTQVIPKNWNIQILETPYPCVLCIAYPGEKTPVSLNYVKSIHFLKNNIL